MKEKNSARGMFRPGSSISSPILASLVRPLKLMKTSPVVEKNSRNPVVKEGSYRAIWMPVEPPTM
ncbi:MAG: hypothetical protein NTW26_09515 [bacterium]|nr:hypothetical protein [bacterium]